MKRIVILLITICVIVSGCATVKLTEKNTTIIMAKVVEKEKGAKNITDTFTYEGNIYVFITFRWDDMERPAGAYTIKAKWFNGEKLTSIGKYDANLSSMPYYVWLTTRGTSIGTGKCRVEVYADDIYLGSKSFTVVEK